MAPFCYRLKLYLKPYLLSGSSCIVQDLEWRVIRLADIQYANSAIFVIQDGKRIKIDVIDREFKLPGFTSGYDFSAETKLVKAGFAGQVDILGSILPFQDKILLSTIFDDVYGSVFNYREHMQKLHAATGVVDPDQNIVKFGADGYSIDDISQLRPQFQMVLKRGGDTDGSTESKGLVISKDISPDGWKKALEFALSEPMKGGSFWIIQQFHESASFPVRHIRNSRSKPRELIVMNRFAPYYVETNEGLQLGNVLVTAGTDEETNRKKLHNIHGLRQNTYQAVSKDYL